MTPRVALLVLCTLPGIATAAEEWSLDQALASIAAAKRVELPFTELRHIQFLDGPPMEATGKLRLQSTTGMIKSVETPTAERLVVDGDTLRIEKSGEPAKEIRLSNAPAVRGFVESFRATLAGDRETLERFYQVALDGARTEWRMELTPRGDKLGLAVDRIVIEGSHGVIRSFTTHEANGDYTVMKIHAEGL